MDFVKLVNGVETPLTKEELIAVAEAQDREAEEAATAIALAKANYMQTFREMRRELLNVLTGIAIAEDLLEEFKALRQVLLDIPEQPEVANATTAEEAKQAVKAEYKKAVALAPVQFVIAFKELEG